MFSLQKIKHKNPTHPQLSRVLCVCFLGVLCLSCSLKNPKATHPQLLQVEENLWKWQYKIGAILLSEIDTSKLCDIDKNIWELYYTNIRLTKQENTHVDTSFYRLIPYFEHKKLYHYAAYAYLLKGKVLNWNNQEAEAMDCFKRAETYWLNIPQSAYPLSEVYYRMVLCYKADGLIQASDLYAQKVIEYAQEVNAYHLISESYKLMANTQTRTRNFDSIPTQDVINLYDSALHYLSLVPTKSKGNYHGICLNKALYTHDTAQIVLHSKYLVDTLHFLLPASCLTIYYLNRNNIDSAAYYLEIFKQDTLNKYNTRRELDLRDYLTGRYYQTLGNTDTSTIIFKQLYDDLFDAVDANEKTRTYTVSRKYDVEKERSERLQAELEKKSLMIVLIIIGASLVTLVLFFLVYGEKNKRKQDQLAAQNTLLRKEIEIKRESLRKGLLQRIELSKQVEIKRMNQAEQDENAIDMPAWVRTFLSSQLLTSNKNTQVLQEEFNTVYHNMLTMLQADYPNITRADITMCVLITLQIPISDVCILMHLPKQTVWNRRNRIKEHIGLGSNDDLERWLNNYAIQVALRSKSST